MRDERSLGLRRWGQGLIGGWILYDCGREGVVVVLATIAAEIAVENRWWWEGMRERIVVVVPLIRFQ